MPDTPAIDRRAALLFGGIAALSASSANAAGRPVAKDELKAIVDTFFRLVQQRDKSAIDMFDPSGVLIGSAAGEVCDGRDAIGAHLDTIYGLPVRLGAEWHTTMARSTDAPIAWFWAEGDLLLTSDDGDVARRPYRLACVLVRDGKTWRIQLFSGSEPVVSH